MEFLEKPIRIDEQTWEKGIKPLVTISCITYNHEKYIREAIESFLMQETTFPVEINIHDDASTDGTADIISEYEKKYPHVLFNPIYQTENQYSKHKGVITKIQYERAQGKYYATCEGDDYWIDPLKLQKQVKTLEENHKYNLVCSAYEVINMHTNERKVVVKDISKGIKFSNGFEFGLEEMKTQWLTKTLTCVVRSSALDILDYKYRRDIHFIYHTIKESKAFYSYDILGVYRIHQGGVNSMKSLHHNYQTSHLIYKELYKVNNDEFSRIKSLRNSAFLVKINFNGTKKTKNSDNVTLLKYCFSLVRSLSDVVQIIRILMPETPKMLIKRFKV